MFLRYRERRLLVLELRRRFHGKCTMLDALKACLGFEKLVKKKEKEKEAVFP